MLAKKGQKIYVCEMAKDVGFYYGLCQDILGEYLRMRPVSPKFYSATADRSRKKILIYLNMQK
jgi:hypothetical protein